MLLCWVATYWTMPAILVALERIHPLQFAVMADPPPSRSLSVRGWRRLREVWGSAFGVPFAWIVARAPRLIVIVGLALAGAGAIGLVRYIRTSPMEYDMNNLRNARVARAEDAARRNLAVEITGYVGAEGMAILVDRTEQVAPFCTALCARRGGMRRSRATSRSLPSTPWPTSSRPIRLRRSLCCRPSRRAC